MTERDSTTTARDTTILLSGGLSQEDPLGFGGGDTDLYAYVGEDPIGLVDPFGLCAWQVQYRPLKNIPLAGPLGLDHYYFYNTQTGQSIGLGPNQGTLTATVPGNWETNEKPGQVFGNVPDWACNCLDRKAKNPGKPPNYCTFNGKPSPGSPSPCMNCMGWVNTVLLECYNQAYSGQP
jgi:hypothetical protein